MGRKYRVVSADGHLEIPPEMWTTYVPEPHRARAPRLIELADGGYGLAAENRPVMDPARIVSGKDRFRLRNASFWDDDGTPRPGTGGSVQRLHEQDADCIDAEVLYPPGMLGVIEGISSRDSYLAVVQGYNSFLADYCAVAPDRLIGCALVPTSGISDAVSELRRCHELGLRAVTPHQFPNGSDSVKPEDDMYWETAQSLGIAVTPHIKMGASQPPAIDNIPIDKERFAVPLCGRVDVRYLYGPAQLIASGVFDRFPDFRMYFAETYASWLPLYLYFMDENYEIYKDVFGAELRMLPSEYILQHVYFGIIVDPLAVRMRDLLPVENLMWGSDFPHRVGSWPESNAFLDVLFDGAPDGLRETVLVRNPALYFGLDADREVTETPAAIA